MHAHQFVAHFEGMMTLHCCVKSFDTIYIDTFETVQSKIIATERSMSAPIAIILGELQKFLSTFTNILKNRPRVPRLCPEIYAYSKNRK